MICRIRSPFASLYPMAGVVLKPELVQLFPTLLVVVCHREPGRTIAGTAFQTECLLVAR